MCTSERVNTLRALLAAGALILDAVALKSPDIRWPAVTAAGDPASAMLRQLQLVGSWIRNQNRTATLGTGAGTVQRRRARRTQTLLFVFRARRSHGANHVTARALVFQGAEHGANDGPSRQALSRAGSRSIASARG